YTSINDLNIDLKACFRLLAGDALIVESQEIDALPHLRREGDSTRHFPEPSTLDSFEVSRVVLPQRSRRPAWIGAAFACAAAAAAAGAFFVRSPDVHDAKEVHDAQGRPPAMHAPAVAREISSPPPVQAASPQRTKVKVMLASTPANASVVRNGAVIGT